MDKIEKNVSDYDVIVVGAGPTGLMLACELKLNGVNVAIIERRAHSTTGESRAPGINARTMEVFKMRGLAKNFEKLGAPMPAVLFSGMVMNPKAIDPEWPDALILPQHQTERLLAEHAIELGVSIYWSTELLHFKQNLDGVDILVQSNGEVKNLKALYIAGCDGGHSAVRRISGASFNGDDPISHWVVADVQLDNPPDKKNNFGRNTRVGTYQVSTVEAGWYRVNIMKITPPVDRSESVTLEELRRAMIDGIGTDYGLKNARWMSRYGDGFRQVANYRNQRVLLLGDAAHTHSPIGGQGLNLGIQDAMNLGWKLGLVVTGQAPDSLLDTFNEERHPVAATALQMAKAQTALIKPGEQIEALRAVMSSMVKVPEITRHLSGVLSGLGLRYSWGEGQHPLVGQRVPDLRLLMDSGEVNLFSLMNSGRPLILNFDAEKKIVLPEIYKSRVDVIDATALVKGESTWKLPVIGEVDALSGLFVRPDGYIAWVLSTDRPFISSDLNDTLKHWIG